MAVVGKTDAACPVLLAKNRHYTHNPVGGCLEGLSVVVVGVIASLQQLFPGSP